jgi:hypothetical protein
VTIGVRCVGLSSWMGIMPGLVRRRPSQEVTL